MQKYEKILIFDNSEGKILEILGIEGPVYGVRGPHLQKCNAQSFNG